MTPPTEQEIERALRFAEEGCSIEETDKEVEQILAQAYRAQQAEIARLKDKVAIQFAELGMSRSHEKFEDMRIEKDAEIARLRAELEKKEHYSLGLNAAIAARDMANDNAKAFRDRAEKAEAELEMLGKCLKNRRELFMVAGEREEQAEAREAKLREALERIARAMVDPQDDEYALVSLAKQALASREEGK